MNFLLCSLGSHGDIHPYLAIGRELNRPGHTSTLATSKGYRHLVLGHGLGFTPIRPESPIDHETLMARIMDARRSPETGIRDRLMPAVRDTYQDLVEPASRADLLVSHTFIRRKQAAALGGDGFGTCSQAVAAKS